MRKTAIFVEGQAELIFVREFLLKIFDYQDIEIECRKQNYQANQPLSVPYDFPNAHANFHFQIINVGNDVSVVSQIIQNAERMKTIGYHSIVGLRDMFSEAYTKACAGNRIIQENLNQKFQEENQKSLQNIQKHIAAEICFAIMEIEAWLLGIPTIWVKKQVSEDVLTKILGENYEIDPEVSFFHPTTKIKELLITYSKHADEIESLVGNVKKEDFENLLKSSKCASFKKFNETIFN